MVQYLLVLIFISLFIFLTLHIIILYVYGILVLTCVFNVLWPKLSNWHAHYFKHLSFLCGWEHLKFSLSYFEMYSISLTMVTLLYNRTLWLICFLKFLIICCFFFCPVSYIAETASYLLFSSFPSFLVIGTPAFSQAYCFLSRKLGLH